MPENLVSRDGFSRPVPRQPAHLHTRAESGAYLRDSSRVPRRRPFMKPTYAIGSVPSLSGHAIASRALSLRNLVSGYECGRVFPAGVGPGSPLRDAANWLPSRSYLSVETRRQYGWLRMVFSGVRLFRAPIWWPSGGWRPARGREHCRGEPGGSLSGGYAPDSAKAEGSSIVDEPGEG